MASEQRVWETYEGLDPILKEQLQKMTKEEKTEAFFKEIGFGTGGMRGILGPGTDRMNIYTVKRAMYAYAKLLKEQFINPHVVIGYDNRHMSKEFAYITAGVLGLESIRIFMFEDITPTPIVSFACKYLNAGGAVMFTASHNPPSYNGMKFYGSSGGQLDPTSAKKMIEKIDQAPHYFQVKHLEVKELVQSNMLEMIGTNIHNAYFKELFKLASFDESDKRTTKVTFSALHGTTQRFLQRITKEAGYDATYVLSQSYPDPDFSTVELPNPEYFSAFEKAIEVGKKHGSAILLASDPDGDRLGICVKQENGTYILLSGNQLGFIYLDYLIQTKHVENPVVVNTMVSSALATDILKKHHIKHVQTLTGFKYIIDKLISLKEDETFLLGYEESNGYLFDAFVYDKDALQAAFVILEALHYYQSKQESLLDVLNRLYKEYGYVSEETESIVIDGIAGLKIQENIMEYFRSTYKDFILKNQVCYEDYLKQTKVINNETSPLDFQKSNVIRYVLEDGSFIAFRPSGTEPKLKVYFSIKGKSLEIAKQRKDKYKEHIMAEIKRIREELE